MRFQNNIVVITGSSRGIGKDIAKRFAQEGACVILISQNPQRAEENLAEFQKQGWKAESHVCDVTNLKNMQEIVNKILDKHKTIDILVNNAGITKDNLLLRMDENDWDEVISVNLRGTFITTKVISKVMLKAKKGKIINISSIIGIKGNAGQANYAASKAGIIGFTKSVALEYASRGITVNAIAPGYIQTDMTDEIHEKMRTQILDRIPMGRFGTTQDVASVCLFLASKETDYLTGQTIVVDGGMAIA